MNTLFRWFVIVSMLVTFASSSAWAGEVMNLKTFNAGDPALADEVNANFLAVKTAVDDNDSLITTNRDNLTTNAAGIAANTTDIDTIKGFLPIAFANIDADGSFISGTPNVSSSWNSIFGWYEITISGENYLDTDYITVVTPKFAPFIPSTSDVSTSSGLGALVVLLAEPDRNLVQGAFQFVTFKP